MGCLLTIPEKNQAGSGEHQLLRQNVHVHSTCDTKTTFQVIQPSLLSSNKYDFEISNSLKK